MGQLICLQGMTCLSQTPLPDFRVVSFYLLQKSNVRPIVSRSHSLFTFFVAVIDKTAGFVANSANPLQFEDKIRENQRHDPKFAFLNPADPYHGYYRHRIERIAQGEVGGDETPGIKDRAPSQQADDQSLSAKPKTIAKEPPPSEWVLDLPNISAVDLCATYLLLNIMSKMC